MNRYVATFHTHLAAMRTHRRLTAAGLSAELAPVPRRLSASCGTCVLFDADGPHPECMDADTAAVALILTGDTFQILYQNG